MEAQSQVGSYLDVAARPPGQQWRVSNTEERRKQLVKRVQGVSPALVVLEEQRGPLS